MSLRNVGKAPEKIAAAIPSCTCVFARFPQTEIAPGDEADGDNLCAGDGTAVLNLDLELDSASFITERSWQERFAPDNCATIISIRSEKIFPCPQGTTQISCGTRTKRRKNSRKA